jgi:hypothetical protein
VVERSAMASSSFDCCRRAVAPVQMAVRESAVADAAEVARGSMLDIFSRADWWSRQLLLVSRPSLHKFAAEISVAVNVGEGALLGPMLLQWLS